MMSLKIKLVQFYSDWAEESVKLSSILCCEDSYRVNLLKLYITVNGYAFESCRLVEQRDGEED